ncbi:AfsA-related hotdog domain-containing protein [Streptomyces spiramyceticus]|uniref:AfsA-related hotdog domain-containing protein n=1 Tax=Streptomyces spiramyceticus TaxID=299717 RepID=UPI00237A5162|nr:AfsA-related hotdog domain-containing protein [Streptomyces spiramyceticus]
MRADVEDVALEEPVEPVELADHAGGTELDFGRTVERSLVHRAAVSEVFLTDVRPLGLKRVLAAAQLPLSHAYYNDHTHKPARHDPLLLLEAARQAAIHGSHTHLGVRSDTAMIVDNFRLELTDSAALLVGDRPGELVIDSRFEGRPTRTGVWRRGSVTQDFHLGGEHVGTHTMYAAFLTHHSHEALRHAQRGTPAPSSADCADTPDSQQVEPGSVGRVHPLNVLLSQPVRAEDSVCAQVTPRFGNRSLFDHAYDHLPAMLLTEAAHQLALLTLAKRPETTRLVGIDASFQRYAELDEPLTATATQVDAQMVDVAFSQGGSPVAQIATTLHAAEETR